MYKHLRKKQHRVLSTRDSTRWVGVLNVECQRCYTETKPKNRETQKKRRQKYPDVVSPKELKKGKHFRSALRNSPQFSSQKHRVHQTTKRLWTQGVSYQERKISLVTSLVCSIRLSRPKTFFRASLPCPQEDPSSSEATRKGKGPRQDGPSHRVYDAIPRP